MTTPRVRTNVSPLRRPANRIAGRRPSVFEVVAAERPAEPLHCLRSHVLKDSARRFLKLFPGKVLYAVKCNPEPAVLRALHSGGIRHFDVASLAEIRLLRQLFPAARLHYMHPVKPRRAIRDAYFAHGVRDYALDSPQELTKILAETGGARDLGLIVRLALPRGKAVHDLSGKFGASPAEAVELLRAARRSAERVGVTFHVGSQCLDPAAWEEALALVGRVVAAAAVMIDVVDVGGGFAVAYPGVTPPPLDAYVAAIRRGLSRLMLPAGCELWCEPGRALVASGVSLVVQVELRRGGSLYINDGVYGSLSDAGQPGFRYPARLIRPGEETSPRLAAFALFGPTCDSADRMAGPFWLPEDTREGDWIELGQLGAYGASLRTGFNGFDKAVMVDVRDAPPMEEEDGSKKARTA